MDRAAVCEALKATQQTDGEARKKAEEYFDEAAGGAPNRLVGALCSVLKASAAEVEDSVRQEAAVILRQLVVGLAVRDAIWDYLEAETKTEAKAQLLASVGTETSNTVRRSAGQVITAIVNSDVDDFEELQKEWPALLPALSHLTASGTEAPLRVIAVGMLRDMIITIGAGFFAAGSRASLRGMLASLLSDQAPEVRSSGAQLAFAMVESLPEELLFEVAPGEAVAPLAEVMPVIVKLIQGFANSLVEEPLTELLEALIQAVEAQADFFKKSGCLKELSETLIKIASAGAEAFSVEDIRHSAMEALMALATDLYEDVSGTAEGRQLLEAVTILNIEWMTEVEEDVDVWTKEGKDADEDECDDDVVGLGEENLDRLAETFDEAVFMPILFKVLRGAQQAAGATWKTVRSTVMAVAQVVEHLEDEGYVDQCVDFVLQHVQHDHPRVRYAVFWAISQACYDQSPHVQEKYDQQLLPLISTAIGDTSIRVATSAVSSFVALSEDLDCEDLEEHMDDLLMKMFNRLHAAESQALQEQCLNGIAAVAEVGDDAFAPYYSQVMPMLKQVITNCKTDQQRSLQGKALECVALIGCAVGKETFRPDAQEVMESMIPLVKNGFEADDPRRDSWHEATAKIAETLGKDFKPFVHAILPSIFKVLKQKPAEGQPISSKLGDDDDDDDDDASLDENLQLYGLKTSVFEEMEEALELADTLIQALQEEFADFMPATCQSLSEMLDTRLSETVEGKVFDTWGTLAECARTAVMSGKMNGSALQELLAEFLRKTVGAMLSAASGATTVNEAVCSKLQLQASGLAGVVKKAGEGVLTKDGVKDVAEVIVKMLDSLPCGKDVLAEPGVTRRRGGPAPEEDSDGDEKEPQDEAPVSAQSVRFSLCDVAGALMRANREEFCEVALPTFMELVKALVRSDRGDGDRSLGFYIADDVVACLGARSVPYWNGFMNEALTGMVDNSAVVRQYAASTIGHGAPHGVFAQVVPAAASQIHKVLSKQGERHRRRRAVKATAVQNALAVDANVRALGLICEHHEAQLGADAKMAWSLWVANLPIKYSLDAGKAAHMQLVELVTRNHGILTSPELMPRVLGVLAEVYRSKFSSPELDLTMAKAVASVPEAALEQLKSGLSERQQKKVGQMLTKAAEAAVS